MVDKKWGNTEAFTGVVSLVTVAFQFVPHDA